MWFWKMLKVVCKVIWTWRKSNWILDKRSIGLNGHPSMNDSARINFLLCGHEIYSFGWPFLSHHYYITSLSNLCLVEEKMLLKTNSIYTFLLIWQRPSTRSSASGVTIFTILIDPSCTWLIFTSFIWSMPRCIEEFWKEIMQYHCMTYKSSYIVTVCHNNP